MRTLSKMAISANRPLILAPPAKKHRSLDPGTHRFSTFRLILSGVAGSLLLSATALAGPVPVWPDALAPERKELLEKALGFLKQYPSVPYQHGGADSKGMDCSGAIPYMLKLDGGDPPRSADAQFLWLRKLRRLTPVSTAARTPEDPVFASLQPGDLIFWAHEGAATSDEIHASHVHLYLGREKDDHAIMIGSSEGRSYRGKKLSGFGITDFLVPKPGSPTRIVGYGPPPPLPPPTNTAIRAPKGKSPPAKSKLPTGSPLLHGPAE